MSLGQPRAYGWATGTSLMWRNEPNGSEASGEVVEGESWPGKVRPDGAGRRRVREGERRRGGRCLVAGGDVRAGEVAVAAVDDADGALGGHGHPGRVRLRGEPAAE